jgi:Cu(I)/Ag(I) efflux system membrane fusion protein
MMRKYFILFALLIVVFISCKKKQVSKISKDEYYTCSMHPQVIEDKPGNCPICHMELIVVKKTITSPDEIMLNDEQERLGNIQVDTIGNSMIGNKVVLTATLNVDESKNKIISARLAGRIDRLYFKNIGDYVTKGAHLFDLYSEELNNAKQEYIATLERKKLLDNSIIDFNRLIESAKTKLLLWGMSPAQINELEKYGKSSPLTSFYSTASGFITELPVMEGQFLMEGSTVIKLADLSSLWAEAQVYASEMYSIEKGMNATIQIPDLPGKEFTGKTEFVNPEIATDTRVNLIRITVANNNGQLRPGMPAYVIINNKMTNALTLPVDAVLREGEMNVVWVKSGKNSYKIKMVTIGQESGNRIEIKSGLQRGDVVVTSGAYLINSEYIFKKGTSPTAGHDMGKM